MPDDGLESIVRLIEKAEESLDIKIFLFNEPSLIQAVIAASGRGVRTRVMLNPATRSGESLNDETRATLHNAGVLVRNSHPAFAVTHEKSVVVDGRIALVQSMNWTAKNFSRSRDYGILTSDLAEVEEILDCFNADWTRTDFKPRPRSRLIWSPGDSRSRIASLIDNAKEYVFLQNERYQDMTILEHLVRAKHRGVHIHVMAIPPHKLKHAKILEGVNSLRLMDDVGIKIHRFKKLHLHAKMLLVDEDRAVVGSMNMTPGSFDQRRELGIEVSDEMILKRLKTTFERDWEHSHPLDLSDEGIRREMRKHG